MILQSGDFSAKSKQHNKPKTTENGILHALSRAPPWPMVVHLSLSTTGTLLSTYSRNSYMYYVARLRSTSYTLPLATT